MRDLPHPHLRDRFAEIVGPQGLLEGDDIGPRYFEDMSHIREGRPHLVLRPRTTEEVARILALCNEVGQPIVPQGGMTGLVSAGTPMSGEVVLATDRMTAIEELDPDTATMTVQCGVPLQAVQERADDAGLMFPLDIGARGSCTIGGNLSTNAGGNRVIRYGMVRDMVLGIEAVLADGTVIDGLHKLPKNNAGYDHKHLFIGSEGTLGVITRAVLRLQPKARSQSVAWCATGSFANVVGLLRFLRDALSHQLTAFEVLWGDSYRLILDRISNIRAPLPSGAAYYVLVEGTGADAELDKQRFERTLEAALDRQVIQDAVLSQSETDVADFWAVRDGISEVVLGFDPFLSYDVSLPIGPAMERFAGKVVSEIDARWPNATAGVFGHIGDGNIHIVTNVGEDGITPRAEVDRLVYEETAVHDGSISAEHGIGCQKREHMPLTRSQAEIELMATLKQAMDPNGILSPGRVIGANAET